MTKYVIRHFHANRVVSLRTATRRDVTARRVRDIPLFQSWHKAGLVTLERVN